MTSDGQVKVLDFGLAKAMSDDARFADLSNSPTLSLAATQAGVILGTAAYMSPEQAKGKVVDRRSDIWAFGIVVFEMLTGRMVYSGETVSETMAKVIMSDPDWNALPAATPVRLRSLLRRCLVKEPRNRIRDIGDVRIAIEEILAKPDEDASDLPVASY
jgi:eukaryotic-like serine/threonine-protein kinase